LYNRSQNAVSLLGWHLDDDGASILLPDWIMMPGEFLLLTTAAQSVFARENLLTLSGLQSLSNDGEYLVLRAADGVQIDSVNFGPQVFGNSDKVDGGWSME